MTSAADRGRRHRVEGTSFLALALLVCAGCATTPPAPIKFGGPTMGTTWSIALVPRDRAVDAAEREAIDRDVRDVLTRIEALMSTWDEDSELSRFNRSRGTEPFPVSAETHDVFRWAIALAKETRGAFDVTVLPLVEAWGFGAAGGSEKASPDAATLAQLLTSIGTAHLDLDPDGRWVRKRNPDVRCDFSGLAPGYAADALAAVLANRGFTDFLVEVGGELVARGRNAEGLPWQVGVERPEKTRRIARVVPVTNMAVATSGDYRNYREVNGARIAHIIDPRSGTPIRHHLASVTVLDALCVRADALATAFMVLGPEEGMALARRLDVAALFIVRTSEGKFDERMTPRFGALTGIA